MILINLLNFLKTSELRKVEPGVSWRVCPEVIGSQGLWANQYLNPLMDSNFKQTLDSDGTVDGRVNLEKVSHWGPLGRANLDPLVPEPHEVGSGVLLHAWAAILLCLSTSCTQCTKKITAEK